MPWGIAAAVVGGVIASEAQGDAADSAANSSREATNASSKATGERLAFDKQQYADGASDRAFASGIARTQAANQAEDRTKYNALQDEQIVRGRKFQGAEDQMLVDAQDYDTPARQDAAAAKATAGVQQSFDNTQAQSQRNLERMGVNPGSGRSLALSGQLGIAKASALAGAANNARTQVQAQGYARKMDAVGLGKGVIGNQATQAGLQLSAGNSAVSNSLVPLNVSSAASNSMSQGYGNAASAYNTLANTQSSGFQSAQTYGANVASGIGNMVGNIFNKPGVYSGISNYFSPSGGAAPGTMNYANTVSANGGDGMGAFIQTNNW